MSLKDLFPKQYPEIQAFLAQFQDSDCMTVKPAMHDLETQAQQAIFWRSFGGIRTIPPTSANVRGELDFDTDKFGIKPIALTPEITIISLPLTSCVEYIRDQSLFDDIEGDFDAALHEILPFFASKTEEGVVDLQLVLFSWFVVASIVSGKLDLRSKFASFFRLYQEGNHPIGFDQHDRLIICVA